MTISGKYELLRPLSAAGFRSFHARHVMTGQEVMVHFLGNGQRYEPRTVSEASSASPGDARAQVLDAGTYEGTQFLVTYPVEDFTSLSEWLETVAPVRRSTVQTAVTPSRGIPIPAPPPPSVSVKRTEIAAAFQDISPRGPSTTSGLGKPDTSTGSRPTGGFTARFGGGLPEPPDPRQQLQVPRQAPPPLPTPAPSSAQPSSAQITGSFTAIFGGPGNPAPVPQSFPAPSTRLPASNTDSGSFSKMFGQQPPAQAPPPAGPAHGTSPSSSEFNKMFLPPDRSNTLPPAPAELGRQRATTAPASREVGGFTEMFGGGVPSSAPTDPIMPPPRVPFTATPPPQQYPVRPPASPPLPSQPPPRMQPAAPQSAFDGATQVFSGPPVAARNAPPPAPVMPSGPSEFTMIHGGGQGGGSVPFAPSPAAPLPQGPAASAGGGWMPELPGASVRPPVFYAPQVSAPSVSGPGVSANGITPPTVRPPDFQAPSMAPPQFNMQMPQMQMPAMPSPPAAPAVPAAGGSTFSPVIAALLSCIGTVAVLAIVYVLVKG